MDVLKCPQGEKVVRRREDGTLLPGGPPIGRRTAKIQPEQYYERTSRHVTLKQWGRIVRKAVYQAIEGDSKARDWLTKVLLERPSSQGLAGKDAGKLLSSAGDQLRLVLSETKRKVEVQPVSKVVDQVEITTTSDK